MSVRLMGANPGLTLFDESGARTAFASVWRVDWSERGSGSALVVWHDGAVRVVTEDAPLGEWLAADFTRHFPEVSGLPWPAPAVVRAPVELDYDLSAGVRARAAGATVEITGPLDRRLIQAPGFDLGGVPHLLSTVYIPCAEGVLTLDGAAVAGTPRVTREPRVSSTAFLADAEVWCRE
ncbi:hypothetical protein QEZ54_09455 [Catellatospora sp. KI3]|uniref:hypothetical protein n=1 Tax=Catellatospora sp. KI3 TaxID=3041620 RepID=UPI0024827E91|nr:hypothetical protein [Catellatospora sp. KI3]MDI1461191.1 hypothetical protein [Catellatospora sp. KI3]